jgi:Protein of unknown function (DUF1648)
VTRATLRNLSLLPWLILPAMLWRYWQLQDLLPQRIAVHFNFNNVPNGWSDRGSFVFGFLGMTVGILALFTILSLIPKRPKTSSWLLLFFDYFVSVVMCLAFVGVLEFNALNRIDSLRIAGRVAMLTPVVAIVAVVISVVKAGRKEIGALTDASPPLSTGSPSVAPSQGRLLAEEIQRAPLAGMFFAVATVLVISAAVRISSYAPFWVKLLLYGASPLCLWVTLQAFGGFRYRITSTGVEVRTGGIRMCSIPKANIQEYRVAQCDPLADFGGWGIRILPGRRAFIWHGHEAVRIRTPRRDFYLGHDQPERLVKDLDSMMKSV